MTVSKHCLRKTQVLSADPGVPTTLHQASGTGGEQHTCCAWACVTVHTAELTCAHARPYAGAWRTRGADAQAPQLTGGAHSYNGSAAPHSAHACKQVASVSASSS